MKLERKVTTSQMNFCLLCSMSLEKIMKEWIKHGLKEVIVGAVRGY
jgi:hypothetical protein